MSQIALSGAALDSVNNRLHVDSIELIGPAVQVTRLPDQSLEAFGFRVHLPLPPSSSSSSFAIPRAEVGQISWKGAKLSLVDRTTEKPTELAIDDCGVSIKDLLIDLNAKAGTEKTGEVHAWLHSPQLAAGGLKVDGTLTPGPQSLAADVTVQGEQLQTTALCPT